MKGLADRAPHLFRKHIVSVDIMTDSEEQALQVITGCFATGGGVPELGLGNAETNTVFNAWQLHHMLCKNAAAFWFKSVVAQLIVWTLALMTTTMAITIGSFGTGPNPDGAVLQRQGADGRPHRRGRRRGRRRPRTHMRSGTPRTRAR